MKHSDNERGKRCHRGSPEGTAATLNDKLTAKALAYIAECVDDGWGGAKRARAVCPLPKSPQKPTQMNGGNSGMTLK